MTKYVLLCAVMVGAALAGYPAGEFLVDTVPRYSAAAAYYPTVGANGSEFLIAWGGMFRTTARLVRVTTGGALLDTGGVSLGDVRTAPMAFDGTRFLVVWHSGSSGSRDVYAARLAADGTVLDPAGFLVSGATGNQQKPAVTFDGTQFVVVWQDARNGGEDIYAARVSGAGAVLDPDGIPVCTDTADQGDPRIAGSGAGALAVWHDARRSDSLDIFAARISPAGTVLDPHGIAVCAGSMYQGYPSVGFGGGQWLVAWEDDRDGDWYFDVWAARVSSAGVVLDPGGFAVSDTIRDQDEVGVVHNGTDFLVYWADYRRRGDSSDIYCSRVAASGTVLDPTGIAVSAAGRDQYTLSAAVLDGTTFLAWEDFRLGGNTPTVYGARVSAAGTVLDPAGIPLAHSAATQSGPVAAGNGTDWLAVWSETRGAAADVYGQRLGPTGVRLDAEPFLISGAANDQANPAVGFDGANWLVVWEDERWGNIDLYAARVSPAGLVLDSAGISVYRGSYAQVNPALAFDGTNYLVAWDNWVTNTHDILGRFVSPAGVVDTHAVRISTATGDQYQPALAFDGTNYLAAWTDGRSSFSSVRCARIAPGGTVLDTAGILVRDSAGNPAVAAGGGQYLLAWADYRRNPYVADAAAGRVSSAGTVLDPGGIMLSTADGNQG
ncbi:hypothetical protein FJY71_05350, partial [candidate division WOR-3 bacterium]|nr:hypothetical protein [candidate division WOR-3 bacterium]